MKKKLIEFLVHLATNHELQGKLDRDTLEKQHGITDQNVQDAIINRDSARLMQHIDDHYIDTSNNHQVYAVQASGDELEAEDDGGGNGSTRKTLTFVNKHQSIKIKNTNSGKECNVDVVGGSMTVDFSASSSDDNAQHDDQDPTE